MVDLFPRELQRDADGRFIRDADGKELLPGEKSP
jgi:hypothetical protein